MDQGALVWSHDEVTGLRVVGRVSATYSGRASSLIELSTAKDVVLCTAGHPIRVVGRGWVRAGDVMAHEVLVCGESTGCEILGIRTVLLATQEDVFTLTVERYENFFVGDVEMLAHNKTPH
jgi:hypothetical protein